MKATNEVIFRTADLDAVRAYYSGRLGFNIVLEREGTLGFDTGAFNVYFERGEPHGAVFEFVVDDVPRMKEELIAAGCELLEENLSIPRVYLRDPFASRFQHYGSVDVSTTKHAVRITPLDPCAPRRTAL